MKKLAIALLLTFLLPMVATASSLPSRLNNPSAAPTSSSAAALSALSVYTPTDTTCTVAGTCAVDSTSELEAFATAHNGNVVLAPHSIILLGDAGDAIDATVDINAICPTRDCVIKYNNDKNAFHYYVPDSTALANRTNVSAVSTATINNDDVLQYVTVASTTGYSIGDYVLLTDSIAVPNRIGTEKTITDVSWDAGNSKCVITTSAAHGYSATHRIYIRNVTATVGGTKIDYLDGSDGWGRLYNITLGDGTGANPTTKFTLQTLDNSTDTQAGTDVNCDTGTWASGGTTSRQNVWAGEGNRVAGIDTVNSRIYLTHRLQLAPLYIVDSATGNVPQLYRYTRARKFSAIGIKFMANGNTADLSIDTSDAAIDVMGVPEAHFEDLLFEDTWDAAILRRGDPGSQAINITGKKLPDRGTNDVGGTQKTITDITVASQAVFTSTSHGFSNGGNGIFMTGMPTGWSAFNNIVCRVSDATANTFKCKDTYGNYLDSSAFTPAFSGTATAGEVANVTGLGYLMSDNSAAFGNISDGLYAEEGRHPFTSDGSGLSWNSVPTTGTSITRFGVPTYGTVTNVVSRGAYGRVIDTHEELYGYKFSNIDVQFPERGTQFASYEGSCGQIRGDNVTMENIRCLGGKQGIRIMPNAKFKTPYYKFKDFSCSGLYAADGSDVCLMVGKEGASSSELWETYAYRPIVDMENITTLSVSTPIWLGQYTQARLNGGIFKDFDDAVDCGGGAKFEGTNIVTDFRDPGFVYGSTWTHKTDADGDNFNLVKMRSASTPGGCSASIVGLINTQGTGSNFLTNVFNEMDTTATKTYFLSQFTEYNPSSVTDSVMLESGATTLNKSTKYRQRNTEVRYLTFSVPGSLSVGDGADFSRCTELPEGYDGMAIFSAKALVGTAGASGSANLFQIRNSTDSVDVFSTKIMVDAGETTSRTAATPYVVNTSNDEVSTNDVLCVDVDQLNTTPPQNLTVVLGLQ